MNKTTIGQNRESWQAQRRREREGYSGPGSPGWTRFDTWMEENRVLRFIVGGAGFTVIYGYATACVFAGLVVLCRYHNWAALFIAGAMFYAGYYIGIKIPHKAKIERLKRSGE